MATLADLKTRRDALQAARDSGVLNLREADKAVTYRSLEEMDQVLDGLKREIARLEAKTRHRGTYIRPRKGW